MAARFDQARPDHAGAGGWAGSFFWLVLILRPIPRPPKARLLRALWSPLDGIWGVFKGGWGVLVEPYVESNLEGAYKQEPFGPSNMTFVLILSVSLPLGSYHVQSLVRNHALRVFIGFER